MSRPIPTFLVAAALLLALVPLRAGGGRDAGPARNLHATGFDPARAMAFTPQYPLWSDGASKRRWLQLPPGTAVDASDPNAWEFPRGTKLWKEFAHGQAVETRLMERLEDGSWRYATYIWNRDGTTATLASPDGVTLEVPTAPNGRYTVPSREDCLACHEGAKSPVLGFSAVQLAGSLPSLAERGVVTGLPRTLLDSSPEIAGATPGARDALGYLHGNCGHCHNDHALPALDLVLAQDAADPNASAQRTRATLVGRSSRFRLPGTARPARVVPGKPHESILVTRMASHDARVRMPPVGVEVTDAQGLAAIARWIETDLQPGKENSR